MPRSHINDEFVRIEIRLLGSVQIKIGYRVRESVRVVFLGDAHCPLSIPRLICTHSVSSLQDAVILAQGIALPAVGQQNALQVRMPIEPDPEHVIDFPLQPIRRRPNCETADAIEAPSAICVFTRIRSLRAKEERIRDHVELCFCDAHESRAEPSDSSHLQPF